MTTAQELADLSLQRAGLPSFPGATLQEQLVSAKSAAFAALRKYAHGPLDTAASRAGLARVEVWEQTNRDGLAAAMQGSSEALPDQIRLHLSDELTRQFLIGSFVRAAEGLGPWTSGLVGAEIVRGTLISERWAREDYLQRSVVFASIVELDRKGYLATLFGAPPPATSGLGLPIVIAITGWQIVAALVVVSAALITVYYANRQLVLNNDLAREMCLNAQKAGDQATVHDCIEMTKELQRAFDPVGGAIGSAAKVGFALGMVYLGMRYGPELFEKIATLRSGRRATA